MTKKKNHRFQKLAAGLLAGAMLLTDSPMLPVPQVSAASDVIVNNTFWKDTSGKNIYSQGGGIFLFGDTYYWYGVHYKGAETYAANPTGKNGDTGFVSVTCYSSKDLVNWKFENDVLTTKSKGFNYAYWFGRLGVAYCKKTKQYVLIAQHNEDVMFAQCSTPTGNFEVKNYQNQIDGVQKAGTGDQTVFTDDDGQSYIICSNKGGRGHQYVVPLSADYLSAGKAVEVAKGSGREGNCMFKYKGRYYFCASDLHGWNASHSYYMSSDNIYGPYTKWDVMEGTDMDFSHVTQTGFFYTVKGSKQETVIFCGDRWSDFAGNGLGYNQWCPLTVDGTHVKFNSMTEWHLNDDTGEWSVGEGNNWILNPAFEADRVTQSTVAGWTASGTGNGNKNTSHSSGRFCAQQWADSPYKATLTQDVKLPNGTYTLKFWARSTGGQKDSKVYVTSAGKEYSTALNKSINNWTEFTIPDIAVTDGKCQVGVYSDANAGNYVFVDDFSLVGNGSAAPVEPFRIADGSLIQNIKVADTANQSAWSVSSGLKAGDRVFGDRDFTFTDVPASLQGAEVLHTSCDSKKYAGDEATFTVSEDAMVYVGMDTRIPYRDWLAGWGKTREMITDNGTPVVQYEIYKKAFKAGETVTLGAVNNADCVNYFAAVKPLADDSTYVQTMSGDVNADKKFDIADIVLLQKWLLAVPETYLADWKAGDLCEDNRLDVFDLCLMRKLLIGKEDTDPDARQMEYLDRGVAAACTGKQVFVSWRSLVTDAPDTAFNVYRTTDGKTVKLNDEPLTGGTNYTDTTADLTKANTYSVKAVTGGTEFNTDGSDTLPANSLANCRTIPIKGGSTIHFVWVGDFDGDGKYDFLVDRPADDHQQLEAYTSEGKFLWSLDLGVNSENKNNISPGASTLDVGMWDGATVYDMDEDGYADVLVRIADGVKFGDGKVYSNTKTNGQAIAVLDGRTGACKAVADVPDDYSKVGPLACMMEIGYLDGVHPSVICWMKNRNSDKTFNSMTCAYGYENGKFGMRWKYINSGLHPERKEYQNGYAEAHQIRVADVDYDGKDEVLHMGYCLNGDGSLRYHIDEIVHGDRWFVGSFENANNGKEMMGYGIQQNNQYGLLEYYYNASTGKMLWTNYAQEGTADVGRGNIGDIDPRYDGFECWSFQGLYNHDGTRIGDGAMYPCIRLWWNGDLLSDQYNDTKIENWDYNNQTTNRLLSPWKITDAIGSERGAPMFYGDILGDWREEVIMTSSDNSKLVIFQTTDPTDTRLYSLAQNPCYRNCMTAKGYYQSHMLNYYLGTGMQQPQLPNISIIQK